MRQTTVLADIFDESWLLDFHQHATGLHVFDVIDPSRHPTAVIVSADAAGAAKVEPPALTAIRSTIATRPGVTVAVRSTERHPVGRYI